MDTSLFFLINQGLQNEVFDLIMPFITRRAYILFALVAIPVFLKERQKPFFVIVLCFIALAVGDGSGNILKHLFERPRPCQSLEGIRLLVGCGSSFSFPSNHAVNAFAIAATFSHFFRRTTVPMFSIAVLVAFSRIYVGVHYPSDVIAGAVWGGIVAGVVLLLHKWSSERFKGKPHTTIFFISLLSLTFFRYYYIVTGPLDLSPDEAHYWEWSRKLDLSYYSKGPAIAYLIAFTTWLMGDTVFAVRFFAPIFLALSSVFVYKLTKELFPSLPQEIRERVACAAGLLLQITPLFATYGVIMTIDSPFLFFWILSLYLFWKAVTSDKLQVTGSRLNKRNSFLVSRLSSLVPRYWLLLGITIGLGLLTKYTMAFFYVCAFLFIIFHKEQRVWLKRKEPYIALVISFLVFSPVIIWNAAHDWVTVKHTAGQAHVAEGIKISFKHFFEFIGSQIGVVTPLLFFLLIYGAIRNYSSQFTVHSSRFLFWFWAPILGFFILKSFQGKIQANWAMPAYVTAFIAATDFFLKKDMLKKGLKILLSAAVFVAFLVTAISHYPEFLNLPVKMDPTSRLKGWKELGIKVEGVYNNMISVESRDVFIFSDKYQVSSELAFYMPSKPITYCVNLGRRMNQYDIWGGIEERNDLLVLNAIFVRIDNENLPEELKNAFDSYETEKFEVRKKDRILRKYFIFKCYGFKGLLPRKIESY
jgi:undecaprenyl-diphosphatase